MLGKLVVGTYLLEQSKAVLMLAIVVSCISRT